MTERAAVAPTRLTHQPALDGIRGLAVAAVVLYHGAAANGIDALESVTHGGFLGVSAFFTLSGFLIASLLLRERAASGSISLSGFWARRARRLLPAVLILIAGVVVLTPVLGTESQLASLPGDAWASLFYVANWRFVLDGSDYAAMFTGAPSPLRHVWSLAVEEQWYVLVPLAAVTASWLAGRRGRAVRDGAGRRLLLWTLIGAVALGTVAMVLVSGGAWDNRAYMGTDTRLAEMAVGAVLAVLLANGFTVAPRVRRLLTRAAPVVLVALLGTWAFTPIRAGWLYQGGLTLHAILVAVLIAAVVQPDGLVRRLLSVRALTSLGLISYGVYLFHWPVVWWATPDRLGLGPGWALAAQIALTLALAVVSYKLVERPIRRSAAWNAPKLAFAGVATFALIALGITQLPAPDTSQIIALGPTVEVAIPTTPPPSSTDAPGSSSDTAPSSTTTTTPPAPLRVMVVGDSFAQSVLIGLQHWGMTDGGMAVMDRTIPGCPFGRGGRNKGVGLTRPEQPDCAARDAELLKGIAEFDPEVVLVAGGMWDITDRKPPGFGQWTRIGRPDYDAYLRGELAHLLDVLQSGGAEVLWANSPYWDPVPHSVIFMGDPPYTEAEGDRVDRYNAILSEELAGREGVEILDITSWMRAQPGGELDPSLRPDGVHFSEASTLTVADWLGPTILAEAGRAR